MINLIMLEEFWRNEENLERHLQSEDYRREGKRVPLKWGKELTCGCCPKD
jgi:quinol monooxygenase YgiN